MSKYKISKFIDIVRSDEEIKLNSFLSENEIILDEVEYINEFNELEAAEINNINSELKLALYENQMLVDFECDEVSRVAQKFDDLSKGVAILTIMPTENCNFRCLYCYENFCDFTLTSNHYDAIYGHIKQEILSGKINHISILWFGGEPLLELKDVINFTTKVRELCKAQNVDFNSSVTTNGYLLTLGTAKKLFEAGVSSASITIDGFLHDDLRVLKNGQGTFDRVLSNIFDVLKSNVGLKIVVRCNITDADFDFSFYDIFKEFAENDKFSIYVRAVSQWSEENIHSVKTLNKNNITSEIEKHNTYIESIGLKLNDHQTYNKPFSNVCYAAYDKGYVFRANGDIVKCTLDLDKPLNKVGTIDPVNGAIKILEDVNRKWTEIDLGKKCHDCSFLHRCLNKNCPLGILKGITETNCSEYFNINK